MSSVAAGTPEIADFETPSGKGRRGENFPFGSWFFCQAEDGIRDYKVTGVQTCALPICRCRSDFVVQQSRAAQPLVEEPAEARAIRSFRRGAHRAFIDVLEGPAIVVVVQKTDEDRKSVV